MKSKHPRKLTKGYVFHWDNTPARTIHLSKASLRDYGLELILNMNKKFLEQSSQ